MLAFILIQKKYYGFQQNTKQQKMVSTLLLIEKK